jgi:hypothetical protein
MNYQLTIECMPMWLAECCWIPTVLHWLPRLSCRWLGPADGRAKMEPNAPSPLWGPSQVLRHRVEYKMSCANWNGTHRFRSHPDGRVQLGHWSWHRPNKPGRLKNYSFKLIQNREYRFFFEAIVETYRIHGFSRKHPQCATRKHHGLMGKWSWHRPTGPNIFHT